ncbi:MAG: heparinase II/III family protein [Armatimonadetes bacterium]|nr:heparinase II/III family protein [Armatimonadota bacterium]
MDYGPHGGVHGHLDKLNLLLFSGDELGGEPRFHRYEDALHGEWTRMTVAHNTLAVDGRSQQPGTGRLLVFDATDGRQIMRAEAAELYPGVLLDRTVVALPDALVDLYHARAARPVTCDRTLRFEGKLQGLTGVGGAALGTRDGYQHLKVVSRVPLSTGGERTWDTPAGPLHVAVAGAPGQELITALGPDEDHIVLLRQTAAACTFAVVYRRDDWGQPVSGVKLTTSADPRGAVVEWSQGGRARRVRVSYHSADWSAGKPPVVVE